MRDFWGAAMNVVAFIKQKRLNRLKRNKQSADAIGGRDGEQDDRGA